MASGKLQHVLQQPEEGGKKVGLSLLQPEAWGPGFVIVMVATNNSKLLVYDCCNRQGKVTVDLINVATNICIYTSSRGIINSKLQHDCCNSLRRCNKKNNNWQSLCLECVLQDNLYSNYSICCSNMVALPDPLRETVVFLPQRHRSHPLRVLLPSNRLSKKNLSHLFHSSSYPHLPRHPYRLLHLPGQRLKVLLLLRTTRHKRSKKLIQNLLQLLNDNVLDNWKMRNYSVRWRIRMLVWCVLVEKVIVLMCFFFWNAFFYY